MRYVIEARIPTERGNAMVRDGNLASTIQAVMEDLKPEAAYFTALDGMRAAYLVVNIEDASQIPSIGEPLFLALGAMVEVHPVMLLEDLTKAGPAIQQAAEKYR